MGTSRSAVELAGKIARYAVEVDQAGRSGVKAASQVVKDVTVPLVRAATGGDGKLSGVGKNGARIGVRYDIRGTRNPTSLVKATGPAHLAERDVAPHPVVSKYAPGGRVRTTNTRQGRRTTRVDRFNKRREAGRLRGAGWDRRAVITFGNVTARYAVESGGSKGRKPYERGFARGAKLAPREFARAQRQALTSVFR